jgi:hypothetical protein
MILGKDLPIYGEKVYVSETNRPFLNRLFLCGAGFEYQSGEGSGESARSGSRKTCGAKTL